jgi:UDP-2,3-diacylglucosamine pyrophosphatase LpxH
MGRATCYNTSAAFNISGWWLFAPDLCAASGGIGIVATAAAQRDDSTTEPDERRLVFLSDLHLATDESKRDFFAHDELSALLDNLIVCDEPVDLIIAGDFFDLLQLTVDGQRPGPFGDGGEARVAAFRRAFEQPEYAGMLERLRRFTALPGNRTIYLIGNHDSEMGWNDALRAHLLASGLISEISLAYTHTYGDETGAGCLVYCEHGNDYDGVNTIGDYRNPAVTPLGAHIVTDLVNYLEPLGRHAATDAPTSIADIDNIHPLGMIPWWLLSTYFYRQIRRLVKYVVLPGVALYLIFHLLPLYLFIDEFSGGLFGRGYQRLPSLEFVLTALFIAGDSSLLLLLIVSLLVRYDFARTRRRYGLQDPDDIFRRGARHYRRTCEALVCGALRPAHWPAEESWAGADLFVYGHTHTQALSQVVCEGTRRAFANTGTWTRKVISVRAHLRLPPVFYPLYELNYVTVRRVGAAIEVELWEWPKSLNYRLPWTERLATIGRRPPRLQLDDMRPYVVDSVIIPFRPGIARREAVAVPRPQAAPRREENEAIG